MGQDGFYFVEFFLEKGYLVWGMFWCVLSFNMLCIDYFFEGDCFEFVNGDFNDVLLINCIFKKVQFDEIYNFGVQLYVQVFFEIFEYIGEVIGVGMVCIFEVMFDFDFDVCFYQVLLLEMFGKVVEILQMEKMFFYLCSLYVVVKVYVYYIMCNYCEVYGVFGVNGIFFNYELLCCGEIFVMCKILCVVVVIFKGC